MPSKQRNNLLLGLLFLQIISILALMIHLHEVSDRKSFAVSGIHVDRRSVMVQANSRQMLGQMAKQSNPSPQ
eukprot:531104-Hanusia_phi.AAC.1